MRLNSFFIVALSVGATALAAQRSWSYPQFQFTTGADTCTQCHVSPGGGGLINDYGRDEAGGTISRNGNGGFLHGAWTPPPAVMLGGDFRSAAGFRYLTPSTDAGETEQKAFAFPMQAELYAHAKLFKGLSVYAAGGLRAIARNPTASPLDRLGSREHYLQYTWDDRGYYARAGRFYPVFGVRTQDHTAMVRRYQDMYLYEEPYGVAVGRIWGRTEWHAQAFAPQPGDGPAPKAYGAVGYFERRNEASTYAWAAQAKASFYDDDRARYTLGTVQKWWLPASKVLFLHELDVSAERYASYDQTNAQVAMYLAATKMLLPGWMIGGALHAWDPDILLRANSRTAAEINVQWFFGAHFELHATGRAQVEGLQTDHPDYLALVQLHYFL